MPESEAATQKGRTRTKAFFGNPRLRKGLWAQQGSAANWPKGDPQEEAGKVHWKSRKLDPTGYFRK